MRTLIVGASLAGLGVAERLRSSGYSGEILLVGDENHLPYDRPPLSKGTLKDADGHDFDRVALLPASWYPSNDVRLVLGAPAVALDPSAMTVRLGSGELFEADDIVVATGSRPRALPGVPESSDFLVLRSWSQAQALSQRLRQPGRLLVVGAGFIGLEVASTAHTLGWEVQLLERDPAPLSRVLPSALAAEVWSPMEEAGVKLRCQTVVSSWTSVEGRILGRTAAGETIDADLVLVATGGVANTEWLAGSGLAVDSGILCDDRGATSHPHIWAVGDVAQWLNAWTGRAERIEQWQAAREQAMIVADQIAGQQPAAWQDPPYFWSDLLGGRVQFLGECGPDSQVLFVKNGPKMVGLTSREGVLRGIFARNTPRALINGRRLLTNPSSTDEASQWAHHLWKVPRASS